MTTQPVPLGIRLRLSGLDRGGAAEEEVEQLPVRLSLTALWRGGAAESYQLLIGVLGSRGVEFKAFGNQE